MKKNMPVMAAVAASLILMTSCITSSLPQKMDSFVDKAELDSDGYSSEDWEKSTQDFQTLVDKYNNSEKQYSEAERQMAARAMGRYHALLLKNGLVKTGSVIEDLVKIIPEYIEGFADELVNNSEGFLQELESVLDSGRFESSFEKLGSALESVFGISEE